MQLQGSLSTTVGITLAFPILSQIIESKNLRIQQELKRVISKHKITADRNAFLDLGRTTTGFQFFNERLSSLNVRLMMICAIIGAFSFVFLNISVLYGGLCIDLSYVVSILAVISLPFIFGFYYLFYWYDHVSGIWGKLEYYNKYFV